MENVNMKHWWNFGSEIPENALNLDVSGNKEQIQTNTKDHDPQLHSRQLNSKETQKRRIENRQEVGMSLHQFIIDK